jgi:hypothetical protein
VRGLGAESILRHLAELAQAGEPLDLSRIVPAERAELIVEAARTSAPLLSAIKRALPPDFLYGEIQIVLAVRRQRARGTAVRNDDTQPPGVATTSSWS